MRNRYFVGRFVDPLDCRIADVDLVKSIDAPLFADSARLLFDWRSTIFDRCWLICIRRLRYIHAYKLAESPYRISLIQNWEYHNLNSLYSASVFSFGWIPNSNSFPWSWAGGFGEHHLTFERWPRFWLNIVYYMVFSWELDYDF